MIRKFRCSVWILSLLAALALYALACTNQATPTPTSQPAPTPTPSQGPAVSQVTSLQPTAVHAAIVDAVGAQSPSTGPGPTGPAAVTEQGVAAPGYDMFLKLDGIPGESVNDKHKDWIELLSFSHGISQPASASATVGGASSAGRANFGDFMVLKVLDKASPKLAEAVSTGKHIREVVIELAYKTGEMQRFMRYTLSDVLVTSVSASSSTESNSFSSGGDRPVESVSFAYAKIQWTYTEFDRTTGKPKGDVTTSWDLVANKSQ